MTSGKVSVYQARHSTQEHEIIVKIGATVPEISFEIISGAISDGGAWAHLSFVICHFFWPGLPDPPKEAERDEGT